MRLVDIYIGSDKLDLFKDEVIEITSSVQDINDITKNKVDFSKDFLVPASERNNKIFKHYYDQDIDNGFDARTKVSGKITIDNITYKTGQFSLLSANIKGGKIYSYSIVFYGDAVNLVSLIGDDKLAELDLSDLDHAYSGAVILDSLKSSDTSIGYRYSLIQGSKQYYYNSNSTDLTNNSTIANIAYASNRNGINWTELRPSVKLIKIIEAIENKYSLNFSRQFFGSSVFDGIYMWMNAQQDAIPKQEVYLTEFTHLTTSYSSNRLSIKVNAAAGYENKAYRIRVAAEINGRLYSRGALVGGSLDNVWHYVYTVSAAKYNVRSTFYFYLQSQDYLIESLDISIGSTNIPLNILVESKVQISNIIPEMKVIDFLKGLFQMFKLIVYQEGSDVYVNTLNNYYEVGNLYDITKYTDLNNITIERGELLNSIIYKFNEPNTILQTEYYNQNRDYYGDLEFNLVDENNNKLDGQELNIEVPFEQMIYERLTDQTDSKITNVQYGLNKDSIGNGSTVGVLLHYIVNMPLNGKDVSFTDENLTIFRVSNMNLPFHSFTQDNDSQTLLFEAEYSTWNGVFQENSLFQTYHSKYIQSIFNSKKRVFKVQAKLPFRVIKNIALNDAIQIRDNYYTINKINYNLISGVSKMELVNNFNTLINQFSAASYTLTTDNQARTVSVAIYNFTNVIINNNIEWINNVYIVGSNVFFSVDENTNFVSRIGTVILIDGNTLREIEIDIVQSSTTILMGNTTIIWGNNDLTFG